MHIFCMSDIYPHALTCTTNPAETGPVMLTPNGMSRHWYIFLKVNFFLYSDSENRVSVKVMIYYYVDFAKVT